MPSWFPHNTNADRSAQTIIDHTVVNDGMKNGAFWVRGGAFTSNGLFKGALKVSSHDPCHVAGIFNGGLTVLDGATVHVHGIFRGDITVAKGGTLILMHRAMINATIDADGTVVDRGALISSGRTPPAH